MGDLGVLALKKFTAAVAVIHCKYFFFSLIFYAVFC